MFNIININKIFRLKKMKIVLFMYTIDSGMREQLKFEN